MLLMLGGVALVFALELVVSLTWNRIYFTFGIPIFWSRIDRPQGLDGISLEELPKSAATVAGAPYVFRRVAPDAIAFREKPFGGTMHYTPLMRGVIRHREGEASIVLAGWINWTAVAALLLFARVVEALPYLLAAFAVLYLIQGLRYARIVKALRALAPA